MKKTLFVSFVSLASLFFTCTSNDLNSGHSQFIPEVPDYCLEKMWFNVLNDTIGNGADVFYIPSTWEYDWTTSEGNICHYADVYNKEHTDNMGIEMKKVSDYMADGNNFYSPFYRHITLDTYGQHPMKKQYQTDIAVCLFLMCGMLLNISLRTSITDVLLYWQDSAKEENLL
jgi:hypothetical protein